MRKETILSPATVEAYLDAGLLEPKELSVEVVNLALLLVLDICDQSR